MPRSPHQYRDAVRSCSECGSPLTHDVCATCTFGELFPEAQAPTRRESSESPLLDAAFGRYKLKKRLAAGGMGVVYLAEDQQLKRTVALKMIRGAAFANEAELARFKIETEAAAALDHPHITPVYEVGVLDEQPFFTMKLISGDSLATRLHDDHVPDLRTCVSWLKAIAEAVQHAHECGVLHRDLKPGNVLIDASDKPWLTDFGLAKMVHQESGLTMSSDRLGTPHYMAPEVIRDTAHAVSTSTDVWALGVMLWECLCGERPFQAKDPLEVMRLIGESEPVAENTGLDRDLLTLAQRCLEKDPKRRVGSAGLLAEELGRWLAGEPLQVRPVTSGERLMRWVKRNPAWSVLAVVFVIASLTSMLFWQQAERAVDSLTMSNAELTDTATRARAVSLAAEARLRVKSQPLEALRQAVRSVELTEKRGLGTLPESEEALTETLQRVGGVDLSPFGHRPAQDGGGFIDTWHAFGYPTAFSPNGRWAMVQDHHETDSVVAAIVDLQGLSGHKVHRWTLSQEKVQHKAECWLSDSNRLVTVSSHGQVSLIIPSFKESADRLPSMPEVKMLGDLNYSGSLKKVWLRREGEGDLLICQTLSETDEQAFVQRHALRLDSDQPIQALEERILDTRSERHGTLWTGAPDGRWLIGQDSSNLTLLSLSTSEGLIPEALIGSAKEIAHWSFAPDSQSLALRRHGVDVCVMDLSSTLLEAIASIRCVCQHTDTIEAFSFSPDRAWLAAAGNSDQVTVVSLHEPTTVRRLRQHDANRLFAVAFSDDGRWLSAGSRQGAVSLWPVEDLREGAVEQRLHGLPTPVLSLTFSPDNRTLIAHGPGSHLRAWSVGTKTSGYIPEFLPGKAASVADMAYLPGKRWVAVACAKEHPDGRLDRGEVKLIDVQGDYPEQRLALHDNAATGVAFCPQGRWLASTGVDGLARVWKMEAVSAAVMQGETIPEATHVLDMRHTRQMYRRRVAFHPSGRLYATSGDGILFEWDLLAMDPASTMREHVLHSISYILPDVAVSPCGRWLAVARHGWDQQDENKEQWGNMVLLYDVSDPDELKPVASLTANFIETTKLDFSADSRWLAAGGAGDGATIWDLSAPDIGASRIDAPVSAHLSGAVAFSPDSKWLGIGASDGRIHLWDWRADRRPRTIVTGHAEFAVNWLDESRLLVAGQMGRVCIWETSLTKLKALARRVHEGS